MVRFACGVVAMYYRSDWIEAGAGEPLAPAKIDVFMPSNTTGEPIAIQDIVDGTPVEWIAQQDIFESSLYGMCVANLRLEAEAVTPRDIEAVLASPSLRGKIAVAADALSKRLPGNERYLVWRPIAGSRLHAALVEAGYEAVESRRLYGCSVADLKTEAPANLPSPIRVTTLGSLSEGRRERARREIVSICRDAFRDRGESRHFRDPVLSGRLPGTDYIVAVMQLNFSRVDPGHILLAVDTEHDRVCGFTVVGKRPGLERATYSQLLSAVSDPYRGREIYAALTELVCRTMPADARMLNVIHTANLAIQRAYSRSGRRHLEDTVVLRRYMGSAD
jgi:hypothetical protein